MNKIVIILVALLTFTILLLAKPLIYSEETRDSSLGGAGLPSHLQVATTTAVGPDEIVTIFSDTQNCRARAISTQSSAIMITFDDSTNGNLSSATLSGTAGHIQAASTTVIYSSDNVGCGVMSAFGFSSTTITTSAF